MSEEGEEQARREALEELARHALPEDAPGAWIRKAVAQALESQD